MIDSRAMTAIAKAMSPGAVFRILWTAAYGVSVFRLSHRLAPGEDSDALAQDLLDVAIAGLRHGVELKFTAASDTREPLEGSEPYSNIETGKIGRAHV